MMINQSDNKYVASHPDHKLIKTVVNQLITTVFFSVVDKVVDNAYPFDYPEEISESALGTGEWQYLNQYLLIKVIS